MPEVRVVHTGSLRSDVVDTALCVTLAAAMDIVINDATALRDALTHRAKRAWTFPSSGRTHGMHAGTHDVRREGFALLALQVQRDLGALRFAPESLSLSEN